MNTENSNTPDEEKTFDMYHYSSQWDIFLAGAVIVVLLLLLAALYYYFTPLIV